MIKRIKKIVFLLLLFMPFLIKADENYSSAVKFANSYIDSFIEYDKYILFPNDGYFFNESKKNGNFKHGGFLSRGEYLITNVKNNSYLAPGIQYWTLTSGVNEVDKMFVIDYTDKEISQDLLSGVRVTEFVLPETRVQGAGTRSNPWYFSNMYRVSISTSDYTKGQISANNENCNSTTRNTSASIYEDQTIDVKLCPVSGYEFYTSDCNNITVKNQNTNVISIANVDKNLSCKINFIIKVYKINLDTNGGSQIKTKELYIAPNKMWFAKKEDRNNENKITKIDEVPSKVGYEFLGFYTTKNGGTRIINENGNIVSTSGYNSEGTMYANYKPINVDVTFDKQGGTSGSNSVTATYSKAMPSITIPTRTGYTFNGYYTGTNGSGTKYYNANGTSARTWNIANNTTLYAHWTAKSYTVTLYKQNGSGGTSSVTARYGNTMPSITVPTRTGYIFAGYYSGTNGSGTKYYNANGTSARTWNIANNTTLYAHWTAKSYTVTLNKQSGSGGTSSVTATYGNAMPSITVPTRTGYTFAGYYSGTNGSGTKYYNANGTSARTWNIANNSTLYAHYNLSEVSCSNSNTTVKCANYGSGSNPIISYSGNCSVSCVDGSEWRIKLLTSGVFTVSSTINIDAFLVGGGASRYTNPNGYGVRGGAGGRTETFPNISLGSGRSWNVTIGAGGCATGSSTGRGGGATSAFGKSVSGGGGGGGRGGSGGGGSAIYGNRASGGSYGNDGTWDSWEGSYGQGRTTCEFDEGTTSGCTRGTNYAYAGGGGGIWANNGYWTSGAGGVGGGGKGGYGGYFESSPRYQGGNGATNKGGGQGAAANYSWFSGCGGSGVVVIRKAK